jgi:SAM-dependent methyltransferase
MVGDDVVEIYETTRTHLGPLRRGRRIVQRFAAERDLLCGVSLLVGTYGRRTQATATLALLDAADGRELRRAQLPTATMTDNAWQTFPFEPLPGSAGRAFLLQFETDASGDAITLWTNDSAPRGAACRQQGDGGGDGVADDDAPAAAACFKCRYSEDVSTLLDPLLFQGAAPSAAPPPVHAESGQMLRDIIDACVKAKALYFLRLAHLADGFGRAGGPVAAKKVLSVGCGEAFQEAFLAARLPGLDVLGTDLVLSGGRRFRPPNLRFEERDILRWSADQDAGQFDFVFSIECLEHIHDYRTAFTNMAAKVRPGGHLYVSVPFASAAEQQDQALCEYEWREHEHVLPGFTFDDLEGFMAAAGFDVVHASNMFRVPLAVELNALLDKMPPALVDASLAEVGRLFLLDLDGRRVSGRAAGSHGIKILGRRR